MSDPFLLQLNSVSFSRSGQSIFRQLDIGWQRPARVAVIGANGCGKTTLFELIAGNQTATSGQISILGDQVQTASAQHQISYLSQSLTAIGSLSVAESIGWIMAGQKDTEWTTFVRLCLEQFQLIEQIATPVGKLSKGNQQKLFLILTLAQDKPIILLDEAASALDANSREKFTCLIKKYCKNRLLLFSSHHLDKVTQLAEQIVILKDGRINLHLSQFATTDQWLSTKGEITLAESELKDYGITVRAKYNDKWLLEAKDSIQHKANTDFCNSNENVTLESLVDGLVSFSGDTKILKQKAQSLDQEIEQNV